MARPLRIEYPGAYYHILNRGNAGERIFVSHRDKEKFLEYLEKAVQRFSITVHTYCLMGNHYHLLIETPQANLSAAIQWLNVSYATYFNRKRHRRGHLFHGRFKAFLVDADEYLQQLSRYIHLNPVRAKMVSNPSDYKWSSYPVFIKKAKRPAWLETRFVLGAFSSKQKYAIRCYKSFVEDVDIKTLEDPFKNLSGGFILGGTAFVNWAKATFLSGKTGEKEIPQLKALRPRPSLKTVHDAVCEEFGSSEEDIVKKGRKGNKVRDVAIYLSRSHSGLSCNELGRVYGGISGAAITMKYKQISEAISSDKQLWRRLQRLNRCILNI